MRIPFPERLPINRVALFAAALFVVQWLEGTPAYFCVGCMAFIILSAVTFNTAGGLSRASGSYVFAYSLLVFIVGVCYKAYLGEPAQSNLVDPHTDILAYVGSIAAMYVAVIVSKRFTHKTGLLQNLLQESKMYRASIGCLLVGIFGAFLIAALGESAVRLQTAFAQLNQLIPLGIIIGIIYEIRSSGGTRCTNVFIVAGTVYGFLLGAMTFSKQGMIEPLFCWALPICALRYRLSLMQVLSGCLTIFIVFYYLVPFSQYGRVLVDRTTSFNQRIDVIVNLLEHPNRTRRAYYEDQEEQVYIAGKSLSSYFNSPQGFWERLQFISVDDQLINYTDQGHIFGLVPVEYEFINVVPHFIWPDKPTENLGNAYAHEIEGQAQGEGDVGTGIAFSPTGEAYHLAGWAGIFLLAPILWCMTFTVLDSLLGDIRETAWGLLAMVLISHAAPEGGIVATVYLFTFGAEIIIFCAFFATWFAPIIGSAVLGPNRAMGMPLSRAPGTLPAHNR